MACYYGVLCVLVFVPHTARASLLYSDRYKAPEQVLKCNILVVTLALLHIACATHTWLHYIWYYNLLSLLCCNSYTIFTAMLILHVCCTACSYQFLYFLASIINYFYFTWTHLFFTALLFLDADFTSFCYLDAHSQGSWWFTDSDQDDIEQAIRYLAYA